MDSIKKYKVIIAIVLPILILVIIRSIGTNHFENDAKKWAEPSIMEKNIISHKQIASLSGEKLIINLDSGNIKVNDLNCTLLNIRADSILRKKNIKIIQRHYGPVLLISNKPEVSARIWMVISQMGFNNIFIITNDPGNEVFKYKFRPDTLVRPEL